MAADAAPTQAPRGYTTADIARMYRVGEDKVRTWIRRGELRAINTATALCGKPRWIITPDAVAAFEKRRAGGLTPAARRRRRRDDQEDFFPD